MARAVEALFKVTVEGVRTTIVRGKVKRVGQSIGKRPNYKKAIVTLKEGDKIELFEGGVGLTWASRSTSRPRPPAA